MNTLLLRNLQLILLSGLVAAAPMAWAIEVPVGFSKFGRSDSETFSLEEARQLGSYKFPLKSPKDVAAYANSVGFFEESKLLSFSQNGYDRFVVSIRKVSLEEFAAETQRNYDLGLLSRSKYLAAIAEAVPTASYWRVFLRSQGYIPTAHCTLAIKPSGRILDRWSKECDIPK